MRYNSLNSYLKEKFGCKIYKLALSGGLSCPNRDGTISTGGCIFCSNGGSGDFAADKMLSITEQIESAKNRVSAKIKNGKYIAYFQSFTNTYGDIDYLRSIFTEAINHPDIVALPLAPDLIAFLMKFLNLLGELNKFKPVWVELGFRPFTKILPSILTVGYTLTFLIQPLIT